MSELVADKSHVPLRHISLRVPWHDNGWNGCICSDPQANAACLALPNIQLERDDDSEIENCAKSIEELDEEKWPACMAESGTFMAPFEFSRKITMAYSKTSEIHKHILPTNLRHPAYAAVAIPYRWAHRRHAWEIAEQYGLNVDAELEPTEPEWLKKSAWMQHSKNQEAVLEGFFKGIEPDKSLCIFYAKQTPLVDDDRRVIIGAGWVKSISRLKEFDYSIEGGIKSYLWERTIQHSIRPDYKDGFLLPYKEILQLSQVDVSINPADFVAYAPEDRRIEFSYMAEHVTNDGAIASLLACRKAIEKSRRYVEGPWDRVLRWIDARLGELWRLRGPYPGLGAALNAFGIGNGNFLAYELSSFVEENEDPWPLIDSVFSKTSQLPSDVTSLVSSDMIEKWNYIKAEKPQRMALLKLLARFEITLEQALRFYNEELREQSRINCEDEDLITNPYLFYELDRHSLEPISFWTIDRGLYPAISVQEKHPLPLESKMESATDARRVGALIVNLLEQATDQGHTVLAQGTLIKIIHELELETKCPVDRDHMAILEPRLSASLVLTELDTSERAYQLSRLSKMGEIIRTSIQRRIKGKRHEISVDWNNRLNTVLGDYEGTDTDEDSARIEKCAALKELAESRVSVLIGPAGTGKTTLLSILCNEPSIKKAGVLLLAPTGKARVRLQQATGIVAQTIAQFLLPIDRYDEVTGEYRISSQGRKDVVKTVVVDEASMLTEEQLGALLDGLQGVERLILVGDPSQLPPIGSGRPFLDIVTYLRSEKVDSMFPRVSQGYSELIIKRRQKGADREDLSLAEWFSGRPIAPSDDEILSAIYEKEHLEHLRFVSWENAEDLHESLLKVLSEELGLDRVKDAIGFEQKLGGTLSNNYIYFNRGAAKSAEAWQILSPVKGMPYGVRDINRLIHTTYRSQTVEFAQSRSRKIPRPMGSEHIVYGDKVINVINKRRSNIWPKDGLKYVANGEIGIAVGQFKTKKMNYLPWALQVEFSSQPNYTYDYVKSDFSDETNPCLELAYAITVHKAQGSEFGLCFLILPDPCRVISRELLYTALTRQQNRIVIFHQGERASIRRYASGYYSDAAQRLTNIFEAPAPRKVRDRWFENKLVNLSARGEPMASKSEVIIANLLADAGIEYVYEQEFVGNDGQLRLPDFTIEDAESGTTYYWEHLGLLDDQKYRDKWEQKLAWYRNQGVIPIEDGGGERGTLIRSWEEPGGGIDSQRIKKLIEYALKS
jgi:ATP-dependent exoDNAse (exonuclease V) alpha subunit